VTLTPYNIWGECQQLRSHIRSSSVRVVFINNYVLREVHL